MTEENRASRSIWDNKTLIIAAAVVVLVVILMYFQDRKQQQAYELRRLEKRVELIEEWGMPRQNMQSTTPPPEVVNPLTVKSYGWDNDRQGRGFNPLKGPGVKV